LNTAIECRRKGNEETDLDQPGSLDGIMQSPGGPQEDPRGGFELGGWVVPYWDEDMAERLNRTFMGSAVNPLIGL